MAHKKKIGDIFAILLLNKKYAYGRLFLENNVTFYRHRGNNVDNLPQTEDYEFVVCVHKSCFKEWIFMENRPFKNEKNAKPPLYQMKDMVTGNYEIYDYGNVRPSTKEECENLEVCAVWEKEHLIKRLNDEDESWKKWFPRFY